MIPRAQLQEIERKLAEMLIVAKHARIFVTSREKIKDPEGSEGYDAAVVGADAALAIIRSALTTASPSEGTEIHPKMCRCLDCMAPKSPPASDWDAGAIAEIAAERKRQIEVEGWTAEHDDSHDEGEMAMAASIYAYYATKSGGIRQGAKAHSAGAANWPWGAEWFKLKTPRRDLIRAAALIVAEIERLDRASSRRPA